MDYPHLWSRLYGAPLAVHPEKASIIEAVFRSRAAGGGASDFVQAAAIEAVERSRVRAERALEAASQVRFQRRGDKPYAITESGIAVIPVLGTLVQRSSGLDALSGMMSYGSIGSRIAQATNDPDARAILLEVDSYGGEAFGLAELAEQIFAARGTKPLWAAINEQAYSAAYFIAASAQKVTIPVSGGTGSIGTIALHVDQSRRDEKQGYTYTYVHAGARKKDLNPHEPLSDKARAVLQDEVDRHYGLFAAHVAKSRGIKESAVRATEAGLLAPKVALAGGFVDALATFAETVAMLEQELSRPPRAAQTVSFSKEKTMNVLTSDSTNSPAAPEAAASSAAPGATIVLDEPLVVDAAEERVLVADLESARMTERARIESILNADEAKGRAKLASHLALKTSMSADEAKALLAASALEAAAAPAKTPLQQAMERVPNPQVGAGETEEMRQAAGKPKIESAAEIYARWNKPGGSAATH